MRCLIHVPLGVKKKEKKTESRTNAEPEITEDTYGSWVKPSDSSLRTEQLKINIAGLPFSAN